MCFPAGSSPAAPFCTSRFFFTFLLRRRPAFEVLFFVAFLRPERGLGGQHSVVTPFGSPAKNSLDMWYQDASAHRTPAVFRTCLAQIASPQIAKEKRLSSITILTDAK